MCWESEVAVCEMRIFLGRIRKVRAGLAQCEGMTASKRFTGWHAVNRATSVARSQGRCLCLDALDVGAEVVEFLVDAFVTAIDVIDTVDLGDAVSGKGCQHKGRRGT